MITIRKDTEFRFTKQGSEQGIEIHFGKGLEFWSCRRGTDLTEFDALLEYFIPEIDFERITCAIAREWEEALYRALLQSKSQVEARKALSDFLHKMQESYGKKAKQLYPQHQLALKNLAGAAVKTLSRQKALIQTDYSFA